MANARGKFPLRSNWLLDSAGRRSRAELLRTTPLQDPAVETIWTEYFFGSGVQVVGWVSGTSLSAAITLDLTTLRGGIASAPAENDIVVVAHFACTGSDIDVGVSTSGYAEEADLYANDNEDVNLSVSWKRMGSTPDTSVTTLLGGGIRTAVAYVLRGVDTTTALDVTTTTATAINSGIADPPAITPITAGSRVVAIAAALSDSSSDITQPGGYGYAANVKNIGSYPNAHLSVSSKTVFSGTENPGAVTGVLDSTIFSWAAVTLAFRPQQPAITGTAAITEGDDTVVATGTVRVAGTASITEADDTVASTGTVRVAGTASITEDDDTVSATGTVGSAPITGTASITEGDDTVAATGTVRVAGTAAITEGNDTVAATGTVRVAGTASITEGADTVAATVTVRVAGTASITEGDDTVSAAGTVRVAGTASITEGNDTVVATGTVTDGGVVEPPPPVTGGGDSGTKDDWWRSPPGKKKRRKAQTTDTGAPTEAPLSVSDAARREAEELNQAQGRAAAMAAAAAELERQRIAAIMADDELVLLLAA
ncbi:MAG: hypothetical protein ABFD96_06015 [Armatimonadia bacterium]